MFRTELPLTPQPQQLPLSARVLTIGSCFSDSIGKRLQEFKVAAMVNPYGTVFNPISLCRLLRAAAGEDMDWQQHLVEARGRWQSYDLHAELGADSPVELLQHIQTLTREVGVFLATADAVVLTLGSAFAYRLRETDEIISNCHKVPAEKFDKELLTADDIIAAVAETHAYLRRINPRLKFILTVSPVRHIKDTLVLNSASKSMLRVACHYLSELLPDVTYFPAYELLMDDLRDYRFYASDMLHPSEVAEHYIWERFTRTYFDAGFGRFKKEWESIRQALGHRPLHAAAPEHRQFLEITLERLRKLNTQADVRMELLHVERELAALPLPPALPEPEPEDEDDEERIDIGEEASDVPAHASLLGEGAGMLVEPQEEESAEEDEFENPESAYEHAYTAAAAEEDEEEAEEPATVEGEAAEPVRRKKRRSRGGVKRTKRKHARLAAEAAAVLDATGEAVTSTEVLPTTEIPSAEASSTDTSIKTGEPATALEAGDETETPEPARRSRNNRRNRRDRPARENSRRAPLYATEAETTPEAAPEPAPASEPAPVAESEPIVVSAPEQDATEQMAPVSSAPTERKAPSRSRRKAPATPALEATEAEVTLPTTEVAETPLPAAQADALTPAPSTEAAPAKTRSRRKPTKAVTTPVTDFAAVPEPTSTETQPEAPATPARKRAPRKAKSAAAPPSAEASAPAVPTAPEPASETPAAPKRKPRAPRRKPAADASAAENQ
ncbi:GSCFA domain-containing protein [Hymenobacter pini]|uniref:GSCFA domain-containing protein n=1 Tax=Hymenobacter pini TaxID=2880879 RepID=UPI001CF43CF8|nr:GSCFA domain-containing protein [Hymenobacter pini]MCA8831296.1 GSCFA domain-containing protein [Hymenobacter pini]